MKVKVTKGTRVRGMGRLKGGKVVDLPDGTAQFLVNTGQATVVTKESEAEDKADAKAEADAKAKDAKANK